MIEGEDLQPDVKPEQPYNSQGMFLYNPTGWSNEHQLTWYAKAVGQVISLDVPVAKSGTYDLIAHFGKARDYGIFQLNFNGADLGQPIDLYSAPTVPSDEVNLGQVSLTEGKTILKVTVTGKNDASTGYQFGLDYLKLVPAP